MALKPGRCEEAGSIAHEMPTTGPKYSLDRSHHQTNNTGKHWPVTVDNRPSEKVAAACPYMGMLPA